MKLPNAYAQHKGGTRCVRDSNWKAVDFTLDVLEGCEHKCPGCFVNKKLPFVEKELSIVNDLVDKLEANDYDTNELFLGPTDVFSALNLEQIVTNPDFQSTIEKFTLTTTATCTNDYDVIKNKVELLNDTCHIDSGRRDFEIFVVLDIPKYLAGDVEYLTKFNKNLELLYWDNVFFLLNVHADDMFSTLNLSQLGKKIRRDYNTKLRINPSYLRGTNKKHIEKFANMHKNLMLHEIDEVTINSVFLNMLDIYFGGFTFDIYTFAKHELFISPLIYEAVPILDDVVKVESNKDGTYDLEHLEQAQKRIFEIQYKYAHKTTECNNCKFLTSCVSRGVLVYMESRKITNCFLPTSLFRDASKIIEWETQNVA